MSDLVQRLRDSMKACRALDRSALLEEAAVEIARLRDVMYRVAEEDCTVAIQCGFRDSRNAYDPVAYGIECDGELLAAYTCEDEESASAMVERFAATGMTGHVVVPLYRSPALTGAEREAIDEAAIWYGGVDGDERCQRVAVVLRGLLERMK